jgi:hypothetical protein
MFSKAGTHSQGCLNNALIMCVCLFPGQRDKICHNFVQYILVLCSTLVKDVFCFLELSIFLPIVFNQIVKLRSAVAVT